MLRLHAVALGMRPTCAIACGRMYADLGCASGLRDPSAISCGVAQCRYRSGAASDRRLRSRWHTGGGKHFAERMCVIGVEPTRRRKRWERA